MHARVFLPLPRCFFILEVFGSSVRRRVGWVGRASAGFRRVFAWFHDRQGVLRACRGPSFALPFLDRGGRYFLFQGFGVDFRKKPSSVPLSGGIESSYM